jgi:predicted transcriptional regulator
MANPPEEETRVSSPAVGTNDKASEVKEKKPVDSEPIDNAKPTGKKRATKKRGSSDGDSDEKKVSKKPRVKPEKLREVYDKILEELTKCYKIGMSEMPMDTLAVAVGYKHPRSDAVADAMKQLVKDGLVAKTKGTCKFTETGMERYVPKETPVANPEEAMDRFWQHYLTKLKTMKAGSGDAVQVGAKAVWAKLSGGEAFSKEELVAETTYSMHRSTGFEAIMKALKDLGFTEVVNKGKVSFTAKMFPFGKPLQM